MVSAARDPCQQGISSKVVSKSLRDCFMGNHNYCKGRKKEKEGAGGSCTGKTKGNGTKDIKRDPNVTG